MQKISTAIGIENIISQIKSTGVSIGFVPTMGALHLGHKSLLDRARLENDIVVCSIYVNPTQFNNPLDLAKYPVTLENDLLLLEKAGVDIAFLPHTDEIYPQGFQMLDINLGFLDEAMEGKFRPGHFLGVATVVKRLLDLVRPDNLYMGQKDFQQCAVVAFMIQKFQINVNLVVCPTIREKSGLALSSRNMRLDNDWKKRATSIFKALLYCQKNLGAIPLEVLKKKAHKIIDKAGLEIEYFEIVDGKTLLEINAPENHSFIAACCAAYAGEVRLIDNMVLKELL